MRESYERGGPLPLQLKIGCVRQTRRQNLLDLKRGIWLFAWVMLCAALLMSVGCSAIPVRGPLPALPKPPAELFEKIPPPILPGDSQPVKPPSQRPSTPSPTTGPIMLDA